MSVWRLPGRPQQRAAAHVRSPEETAIFAIALLAAIMVGIAASGLLPLV